MNSLINNELELLNTITHNTYTNQIYRDNGNIILLIIKLGEKVCEIVIDEAAIEIIKDDVFICRRNGQEIFMHDYGKPKANKGISLRKLIYTSLQRIDYKTFKSVVYQKEGPVVLKEKGILRQDFRLDNLTTKRSESYDYDKIIEANRAYSFLTPKKEEHLKKRMSADYSRKLQQINTINKRKETSILNEEKVKEIRKLYEEGLSQEDICSKFNISRTSVSDIVCYRSWNEHAMPATDIEIDNLSKITEVISLENGIDETYELEEIPTNRIFKIGDFLYYFRQKVHFQFCFSKHDLNGRYLSDTHILFAKPSHRNKWRNFVISSTRGNVFESYKMDREEIYDKLYSIYRALKNE